METEVEVVDPKFLEILSTRAKVTWRFIFFLCSFSGNVNMISVIVREIYKCIEINIQAITDVQTYSDEHVLLGPSFWCHMPNNKKQRLLLLFKVPLHLVFRHG